SLLKMCKRNASHPAAVAVGIATGADDKMLGHTAMLEANAQRTNRLRNPTAWQALNSEYFASGRPTSNSGFLRNAAIPTQPSLRLELWFLGENFFVSACSGHVVAESANASLGDYKFVAGKF